MKKILGIFVSAVIFAAVFAGCGAQEENQLVSKEPFPEFSETDMTGNSITHEIFSEHDATIVNVWNTGCGSCIEEMPELEEMYQNFKQKNINLIGIGTDSGESEEKLALSKEILSGKGVTYLNISPNPDNAFYKEFIAQIATYPSTYIVDSEGNIVGAVIAGNVKKQEDTLQKRLDMIVNS